MIDLTKPIRRKGDHQACEVTALTSYYVEPRNDPKTYKLSAAEFEAIYENVPEPRRPREWYGFVEAIDCDVVQAYRTSRSIVDHRDGKRFRLIEWPEGAELPEWPT